MIAITHSQNSAYSSAYCCCTSFRSGFHSRTFIIMWRVCYHRVSQFGTKFR